MILTGPAIDRAVQRGEIDIRPYSREQLEQNSYAFRLGQTFVVYKAGEVDAMGVRAVSSFHVAIGQSVLFHPGELYLGHTIEQMGSQSYAATLYANRSIATLGIWIQLSAELGHTERSRQWTLEIRVTKPTMVYAGMIIGKIAFWQVRGVSTCYDGAYRETSGAHPSEMRPESSGLLHSSGKGAILSGGSVL